MKTKILILMILTSALARASAQETRLTPEETERLFQLAPREKEEWKKEVGNSSAEFHSFAFCHNGECFRIRCQNFFRPTCWQTPDPKMTSDFRIKTRIEDPFRPTISEIQAAELRKACKSKKLKPQDRRQACFRFLNGTGIMKQKPTASVLREMLLAFCDLPGAQCTKQNQAFGRGRLNEKEFQEAKIGFVRIDSETYEIRSL